MTLRYSDIITPQQKRTVYNIKDEEPNDWKTFIANRQFNDLLKKTIRAVLNNNPDHHKSIWMMGTYGSGKSHAGAVLKHLMCDPVPDIEDYIEQEFKESQFQILRSELQTLRESKRLFPVSLYGQQSITHVDDLSLQLQREVKNALLNAGLSINVKTDFDTLTEHIDMHQDFWTSLINKNPKLRSIVPDLKMLKSSLSSCDTATLDAIHEVLRENRFDVRMDSNNISTWLIEVQNKLRENGEYDGLLIVWDEFTEICTSSMGIKLLERIQEIADHFIAPSNDSYFLLISHPSALNGLNEEKRNQTIGRYNHVTYNMEPVSAFKIMSRKFKILDETQHKLLAQAFYGERQALLDKYSSSSNIPEETKSDLQKMYPLHPGTADLATYYAREAGSSSRSVFEFLACDAVKEFFDDEQMCQENNTLTADYLWDYVREAFTEDSTRFGAVTEKFNTYHTRIEEEGEAYSKVFKGILLLNALNNIANNKTVTPSTENIHSLFEGEKFADKIDQILDYFNEKSIIQRLPGDIFSIQFTALPSNEIEVIKKRLMAVDFKYTEQIANFSEAIPDELARTCNSLARPHVLKVYGKQSSESTLLSKIENGKKNCSGYELFIAALAARDSSELFELKEYAEKWNKSDRIGDTIVVIFDAVFEQKNYDNFINLMANSVCANKHGLIMQEQTHNNDAKKMVTEWGARMLMGNATFYLKGQSETVSSTRLVHTINGSLAHRIFSKGPESLELIRCNSAQTYWKKQMAQKALQAMLFYSSKEETIGKAGGQGKHIEFLLQDSVDHNLELKSNIERSHPLKAVCDFVDEAFSKTKKNQEFNLGEKLKPLSEAPYGLYPSYAGMGMVAFAMRKYTNQIFSLNGKPRDSANLVEDILDMFKAWENDKKNPKLNFMFESKDSSALCQYLIRAFKLNELHSYKDVTSLTDARWAVQAYAKKKQYPLWSLKYSDCKTELCDLIDKIVRICDPDGLANQTLIHEAVQLFSSVELDLAILLGDEGVFKRGFIAFIQQKFKNEFVLDEQTFNSLKEHLIKNLHSEIGRWSETDVEIQQLHWKMELGKDNSNGTANPSEEAGTETSITASEELPNSGSQTPRPANIGSSTREKLKTHIKTMNDEEIRSLIIELIDKVDDSLLDTIMSYVR